VVKCWHPSSLPAFSWKLGTSLLTSRSVVPTCGKGRGFGGGGGKYAKKSIFIINSSDILLAAFNHLFRKHPSELLIKILNDNRAIRRQRLSALFITFWRAFSFWNFEHFTCSFGTILITSQLIIKTNKNTSENCCIYFNNMNWGGMKVW
jgi:hypothetical protein